MKVITVSFSLPEELLEELDRQAEQSRRTRSSIINQAIREYTDANNSQEGEENNGREWKTFFEH